MLFPRRFEATMSRADFLRLLPAAVAESYDDDGTVLTGASGWRMRIESMAPLMFGALPLERIAVTIELPPWPPERAEAFMRRFTVYFQRGGG